MTFEASNTALLKAEESNVTPNIVLEIDGVPTIYGSAKIQEVITIGSSDLKIGVALPGESSVWKIGGLRNIGDQGNLVSFSGGTSTTISQSLRQDEGIGESISSMVVALIDQNESITNLISPGKVVQDILGRKAKVWFGFNGTAFKEDYILLFRGNIDEVSSAPGIVRFNVVAPDVKKKSQIFVKADTTLTAPAGAGDSTLTVADTSDFLFPVVGPSGSVDTTIKFYVKINDEIIRYEGGTGTTFTGLTRGALGTTAAAHSSGDTVESIVRLDSTAIDIALKLMMSGVNGPFIEDRPLTNFVRISVSETVNNSIFFKSVDVEEEYGIVIGDFITTTGATNGANNVTNKAINGIVITEDGSYITISGVSFVEENDSAALIDFRSKYDTWGEGLGMGGDDVDVSEHERINNTFLSNFNYDFLIKDTMSNAKEFLSKEVYSPAAAYSLPRKAKASVGYHIGPLPTATVALLNDSNIKNPSGLSITRSTSKNFFNAITYAFQEAVDEDRFLRGVITSSATSLSRIPVGTKSMTFKSKGLRAFSMDDGSSENGESLAIAASNRRLKKFKFGAEFIKNIQLNLKTGWRIEIGDIVLIDLDPLKVSDIQSGTRGGESRLFEIVNKTFSLQTGAVTVDALDTNFDKDARYGLISPASKIAIGISPTEFIIKQSYAGRFGVNEFKKWENKIGVGVKVRNSDFSISGTSTIASVLGNAITLSSSLGFTPAVNYVMEFDTYNSQDDVITNIYTFMGDTAFDDGKTQYLML